LFIFSRGAGSNPPDGIIFSSMSDIGIDSDIDIGMTVFSPTFLSPDIGCRISPTLRSMLMPTYAAVCQEILF
jgi:hypothetical protein